MQHHGFLRSIHTKKHQILWIDQPSGNFYRTADDFIDSLPERLAKTIETAGST